MKSKVNVADRKSAIEGLLKYLESEVAGVRKGLKTMPDEAYTDNQLVGLFGHLVWGVNDSLRHATDAIGLDPFKVTSRALEEKISHEALGSAEMDGGEGIPPEVRALLASLTAGGPETVQIRGDEEEVA